MKTKSKATKKAKAHKKQSVVGYAVVATIALACLLAVAFFPRVQTAVHNFFATGNEEKNIQYSDAEALVVENTTEIPTPTLTPTTELTAPAAVIAAATKAPTPVPTKKVTTTTKPTPTPTKKPTTTPTRTPTPTATPVPTIDYSKPWTVATNCPASTQACWPCSTSNNPYGDCRFEPGKTHGFRGWACQNNNPGNIRGDSTSRRTIIVNNGGTAPCGIRYDSRGGNYYVFATYTIGYEALKAYIRGINDGEHSSYTNCGNCTIAFFFSKYAPNDSGYATYVANYIGLSTTRTLHYVIESGKLDAFATAIKVHEGFFTR